MAENVTKVYTFGICKSGLKVCNSARLQDGCIQ